MTEYYKTKLEEALEYQDFVCEKLRTGTPSIIVGAYCSRKYQNKYGESASGIEIKYDMRFKQTGNLYIEVAEKSNENMPDYTPSGILRDDNSWLYLIGDYEQAFLFSKEQLKMIYADEEKYGVRGIRKVQTKTSIGFTYPAQNALNGMCIKHFEWNQTV